LILIRITQTSCLTLFPFTGLIESDFDPAVLLEERFLDGAVILVDKYSPDHDSPYIQTIKRRITLLGKTMSGTPPDEIIEKELSLSGVQRPLDASMFEGLGIRRSEFFRFGEFLGWILYKSGS